MVDEVIGATGARPDLSFLREVRLDLDPGVDAAVWAEAIGGQGEAQAFLNVYAAAAGPVTKAEFDLIIPAIRCRRLIEILTALRGIATGEAWDESPDYLVHNLIALKNLQAVRL